ncbi:Flp pilus assembly complex ATPase component TadA [Candidatus Woesearchaeota archaeon]|jgi:ATPase|nr:Flp pilus assembly complex ATPase component TadA [Candidatus Woesearchaeota archaeon]MBT4111111.1 Flp pilus assembly complex ATPase component TadA [Candidatus Woesearchaeota archaeon]MBT4335755.1 Flp pilus assembly complex ATPase component TadA [Candidatus Woesearchaeota archaeon]MBT4469278.1 Flp pilus assembly complex ATPase component TadA [Candidatus Woesearchaeota archaeon]MBT6744250.1 Flp pilus assembly complex ATPase component TadA [Candidatus Woesearchaeota archaeon]
MIIEKYFDEQTMSVHLRENAFPTAKKGFPGNWKIERIDDKELSQQEMKELAQDIFDSTENNENYFLEIERAGSTIVQAGVYRIVITKIPFSDGFEITAVKPVAKLSFEDYDFEEKLEKRILEQASGILISGSPGDGKTTIARALAEHLASLGKIVKTVESPRDMLLSPNITQYSLNHGERGEIHDVLLLSRPDNTFFDEMRSTEDFQLFADLRLAGIGMVGIVHATNPIDAIQRFIGRIEMGIIPQVIDTVIFVRHGAVSKVLELKMKVKVPSGMTEADLARPVIEVRDFSSSKLEFEIYSYGEHTVVIPVENKTRKVVWDYAADTLRAYFKSYSTECVIEFVDDSKIKLFIPSAEISKIIGPNGKEISKIEKELGLKIDVQQITSEQKSKKFSKEIDFDIEQGKKNIIFHLQKKLKDQEVGIFDDEDLLVRTLVSKKGAIKVSRKGAVGKAVENAVAGKRARIMKV